MVHDSEDKIFTLDKEYRSISIEPKEENGELILEGYAVVFDTPTLIGDEKRGFYEVIAKGSIDESALKDVPLRYNHDDKNLILARTRNKSLELKIDDHGLFIRAKLQANVQQHKDIYEMVKSGLLSSMSFAFTVKEQKIDRSGTIPKRIITKVDKLYDTSIVDFPAYEATEIHARSIDLVEQEISSLDKEEMKKRNSAVELERLKAKIRLSLIN